MSTGSPIRNSSPVPSDCRTIQAPPAAPAHRPVPRRHPVAERLGRFHHGAPGIEARFLRAGRAWRRHGTSAGRGRNGDILAAAIALAEAGTLTVFVGPMPAPTPTPTPTLTPTATPALAPAPTSTQAPTDGAGLRCFNSLPQADLAELMNGARLLVTNGGTTLLQGIACGRACIAVPIRAGSAAAHTRLRRRRGGHRGDPRCVRASPKRQATCCAMSPRARRWRGVRRISNWPMASRSRRTALAGLLAGR